MTLQQHRGMEGLPWTEVTAKPPDIDASVDEIMEFIRAAPWLRLTVIHNDDGFEAGLIRYDCILKEPRSACVCTRAETQAEAIEGVWALAHRPGLTNADVIRASGRR